MSVLEFSYHYDALGRVYEENTVRKVYDGDQILFDGTVRRRWGSLDDPWGQVDSTLAVTHQSVNFLGHGQDDLGAFGEFSGFASPAGFHGRPTVGALNDFQNLRLWDHRARVYSPELKRFLTEDPHGLWGMNQYSYGGNDPVNFRDPSGLVTIPFVGWVDVGESAGEEMANRYATIIADSRAGVLKKTGAYAAGFFASLWTPETSDKTAVTLLSGALVARAAANTGAKYVFKIWDYKRAGGRGINLLKDGKSIARVDWHKFGDILDPRLHIDIPRWGIHHWPWPK